MHGEALRKLVSYLSVAILSLCMVGCDNGNQYDKGYEAAWHRDNKPRFCSKEFEQGYQQGLDDGHAYDEGYYAGLNKEKPEYPKDPDYMDGFKDGQKRRKSSLL
jgi:hypothetical protein